MTATAHSYPQYRGPRNRDGGNSGYRADRRGQQPSYDVNRLAPAIKVKNLKLVADAMGGSEALGVALDLSVGRIEQLLRGEEFGGETAFHIETTLRLPNGFLDQVNPRLTDEILNRLKSLQAQTDSTESDTPLQDSPASQQPVDAPSLERSAQVASPETSSQTANEESTMPRASAKPSKKSATKPQQAAAKKPAAAAKPPAKTTASAKSAPAAAAQRPLNLSGDDLLAVRRANLAVLTEAKGAKGRLAELSGLNGVHISHRLSGIRRFDDEQAKMLANAAQLPEDWFDTPKADADIPAATRKLLEYVPKPRGSIKEQREAERQARIASGDLKPRTRKKAESNAKTPAALPPADLKAPRLAKGLVSTPAAVKEPATTASAPKLSLGMPTATATAAAPTPARAAKTPVSEAAAAIAASPSPATSPAFLPDDLQGIGPIAEALLKTLAGKARQGKLSDEAAYGLLSEVMKL